MHSHVANHPRLGKLFACFHGPENQPSPGDEVPPNPTLLAVPDPYNDSETNEEKEQTLPSNPSPKHLADTYVPSWHRDDSSTPATGRRKATSVSVGSDYRSRSPSSSCSRERSASSSNSRLSDNGMLYFGEEGHDPLLHQASNSSVVGATRHRRGLSLGSAPAGRSSGGPGFASGRDASGNVNQRINDNSPMSGMYAALTYGGSLQLNPAGVLGAAGVGGPP